MLSDHPDAVSRPVMLASQYLCCHGVCRCRHMFRLDRDAKCGVNTLGVICASWNKAVRNDKTYRDCSHTKDDDWSTVIDDMEQ